MGVIAISGWDTKKGQGPPLSFSSSVVVVVGSLVVVAVVVVCLQIRSCRELIDVNWNTFFQQFQGRGYETFDCFGIARQ
jgi:hypothetical protein